MAKLTENRFWRSLFRRPLPDSDLDRMLTMFSNFFLHILPAKVHRHSLKPGATWGLGVISFVLFLVLIVTGVLLMFFYVPSVERAYRDMKDLKYVVSYGVILRNMHRWAAHGMVAAVFLHMVRVFFTGSYKPPREFNWVLGILLWGITLLLSFTGYLLPWDQLAYWAITVGTSIASYPPWIGEKIRVLLLGGNIVGESALLRFYVLHVVFLPMVLMVLAAVHFWRVRKDGGIARPIALALHPVAGGGPTSAEATARFVPGPLKTYTLVELVRGTSPQVGIQAPEEEVPSWPHLTMRLLIVFELVLVVLTAVSFLFDAPLLEQANPVRPDNPAKAPWYFLGIQELVSYSALVGGVLVPAIALLGLMSIPYMDRDRSDQGIWFGSPAGKRAAWISFLLTVLVIPALLFLDSRFGVRQVAPGAPQFFTDLLNPASVLTTLMAVSSFLTWRATRSRRLGAMVLFTAFVSAYLVFTVIGTYFRGPNWVWVWPWQ
ncbi:MAG: cytochrome b N-terminal domain-containing protein [Candidatus Tectomicrobia bacterium]|uniref:Cytochrome b N-terminal domain-containing protein n=1 Tax=Tectimicrobiota bacterium TaxID=2528274 RepID=A0A932GNA8_UNCTE|nr:cytochrome b N-terminal domain-containing protein [Candidatus Tectomicrobia bacterium]